MSGKLNKFLRRLNPLKNDSDQYFLLNSAPSPQTKPIGTSWVLWLVLFVGVCFVVRAWMAWRGLQSPETAFFYNDTSSYLGPARALFHLGRYNLNETSAMQAFIRPPGFPALLAVCFWLMGDGLVFPVWVLLGVSASTCIPVFWAGRMWGGTRVGWLASLFFGFNITSIANAPYYLSDTFYTFWVAWQLAFFIRYFQRHRQIDLWISVLFWGLATLTRSLGFYWILPGLLCVMVFPRGKGVAWKLRALGGCLLIAAFCLFPWMLRNHHSGAGFRLETNSANVFFHCGGAMMGVIHDESPALWRQRFRDECHQEFTGNPSLYPDEDSRFRYRMRRYLDLVAEYPWIALRLQFQPMVLLPDAPSFFENLGQTQSGRGTLDVLRMDGLVAGVKHYFDGKLFLLVLIIPLLFWVGVLYGGVAWTIIRAMGQGQLLVLCLFILFVLFFLILPGPIVMPRYHLPALPMMSILGAQFLASLIRKPQSVTMASGDG